MYLNCARNFKFVRKCARAEAQVKYMGEWRTNRCRDEFKKFNTDIINVLAFFGSNDFKIKTGHVKDANSVTLDIIGAVADK